MQGVDPRKGKAVKPFRLAVGAMQMQMQMQMQETWLKQVEVLLGAQTTRGMMRVSEAVRRDVVRRRWEAYDSTGWGWDAKKRRYPR